MPFIAKPRGLERDLPCLLYRSPTAGLNISTLPATSLLEPEEAAPLTPGAGGRCSSLGAGSRGGHYYRGYLVEPEVDRRVAPVDVLVVEPFGLLLRRQLPHVDVELARPEVYPRPVKEAYVHNVQCPSLLEPEETPPPGAPL